MIILYVLRLGEGGGPDGLVRGEREIQSEGGRWGVGATAMC